MLTPSARRNHGFTFVEVMVAVAIVAILAAVALPSFVAWLQNAQIRTAAESIRSGLGAARAEAIRRNTLVQFSLDNPTATGGTGWTITAPNAPATEQLIETAPSREGSGNVLLQVLPEGATDTTFNGFGRLASAAGVLTLQCVRFKSASLSAADTHEYAVAIVDGSEIKLCDPLITDSKDTRTCPAVCNP